MHVCRYAKRVKIILSIIDMQKRHWHGQHFVSTNAENYFWSRKKETEMANLILSRLEIFSHENYDFFGSKD